ncbi:probable pectinesterase/pectinesterase inhibitor [Vigna radiata var. radiata]|uniref:Probable pectinesterase/pectinesterase inhibitor n=1 Tax=Vigna radiata var. radiata TaxID=3916 RepID=A0A1S3TMR4_VIGRR|nr:probable pectinesterase/pectinesterase inhibitor [Vigna radiata var. radiata]
MSGKIVVSVVSLILVVGVAIGVVVTVNKKGGEPSIQSDQKSVEIICQNTDDKNLCHNTLSSVKGLDAADPKAYIATAVKATMDSVIKAFNMSDRLATEHADKDNGTKMAIDDCKDLLQSAIQSLQLSTDMVQNNNIHAVHDQSADFKNWLSAVISYQQACMEGFDDGKEGEKKIKEQFQIESLDKVQKLTAITLDIVSGLSHILEKFGLKLNLKPASRRLLSKDGYPTWFSASDRKLLAQLGRKGWRSHITPNVVVAQDGSGQFKTIAEAIASYPNNFQGRYNIYVKAGVYDEYITVPKNAVNILLYGDGPGKTVVTGHKNFRDGVKTMQTATFANTAQGFIAKAMTFENTAGADGHQAVAFRNQGDMSAIIEAAQFTPGQFLQAGVGSGADWLKALHVPHALDFVKP